MTDRTCVDHLEDILEAAEKARAFTTGMSYEAFVDDAKTVFAVVRALEVIGEAPKTGPRADSKEVVDRPVAVEVRNATTRTISFDANISPVRFVKPLSRLPP
jgi:uncharacterized protein with HEPN domain